MEAWTPENFLAKTDTLANSVRALVLHNYQLKDGREKATGAVKDAYDHIIKDNVWKIHKLIGEYWRESTLLALDEAGPGRFLTGN